MRCVAEVSSFNLMYNLCMYYENQKSDDKTELTFQPTLVCYTWSILKLFLPISTKSAKSNKKEFVV